MAKSNGNGDQPFVGKKPTRDDLTKAIEAARDAAGAASEAADSVLHVLEVQNGDTDLPDDDEMDLPTRRPRNVTGSAFIATGKEGKAAFEEFMAALAKPLKKAGEKIKVTDTAGWIKIEGHQGHKIYINKGKTAVSRIESTLDPDLVKGAEEYDGSNGRIASTFPPDVAVVTEAITVLAGLKEPISPPRRGPRGR